jgi:hypothetical protein
LARIFTRFRNFKGGVMAKAPMNPLAGPSGPGDKATRTDQLTLGSAFYADDLAELNTAAPKSKTRGVADNVGGRPKTAQPAVSLFAEEDPNAVITAGIDRGDGPGSSALMMQSQFGDRRLSDILAEMIPYDTTGEVTYLYQNALSRGQ